MSDLIDRREVLRKMESVMDMQELYLPIHFKEMVIDEVPTIEERKRGRWFSWDSDSNIYDDISCPFCKTNFTVDAERRTDIGFTADDLKFCPNCGANMRGDTDE